jgi:putative aldouronate transport system permease protein
LNKSSKSKRNSLVYYSQKNYDLYLMIIPAILVILVFNYIPIYGIQLAFKEYVPELGLSGGAWVGLKYISKFITSFNFISLMKNTVSISFSSIIFGFPIPIFLALIFNQIARDKIKRTMQTVVYIPHFISTVVMVGILSVLLAPNTGIAGSIFKNMGLDPINFMGVPQYFIPIYVLSDIWQHAGWNSIIYIAALSSIDIQLYDASKIDGASKLQTLWYIDIPSIMPTIIILLVLNMGNIMSVGFEKAFLMQNALNLSASEVISTYVYKIGIQSYQFSYAAAINLFNNVINFIILTSVNYFARKMNDISLW